MEESGCRRVFGGTRDGAASFHSTSSQSHGTSSNANLVNYVRKLCQCEKINGKYFWLILTLISRYISLNRMPMPILIWQ